MDTDLDPRSDGSEQQEAWAEQTRAFRLVWEDSEKQLDWAARCCGDVACLWVDEENPNPDAPAPRATYEELAGWLFAALCHAVPRDEAIDAIAWLMDWPVDSAIGGIIDEALEMFCKMGTPR